MKLPWSTFTPCRLTAFMALALASATLCASSDAASLTQQVWLTRQALLKAGSADDLAAAALLSPSGRNDVLRAGDLREALLWTRRAVYLDPHRRDLLALELNICSALPGCDTQPLELRLHALDPDNGLPQLAALARARAHGADAQRDAAVIALSGAQRIDFYTNTLLGHLAQAMLRTGQISPELIQVNLTSALLIANNLQRGEETSYACQPQRLSHPGVLQACRRIAQAMQNSDTLITQLLAGVLVQWCYQAGSPELAEARAAQRIMNYRSSVVNQGLSGPTTALDRIRLWQRYPRQEDMLVAQVQALGAPLQPPPGWGLPQAPAPRACGRSCTTSNSLTIQVTH